MNILLLEPFCGGSHKSFVEGLKKHSKHTIFEATLSGRHWQWRMDGGSVSLANKAKEITAPIDVILASSMTNLPAFIALTNPRFAHVPVVLYMHENLITQPLHEGETRDVTYCYINYLSAMVADRILFSSSFHLTSFFDALPSFLKQFPDHQHLDTIDVIRAKSSVAYPGIDLEHLRKEPDTRAKNKHPVIVWNQRWTSDKNPALFFRTMNRLDDAGFEFDLILAGDNRHEKPKEFERAWQRYGRRIVHFGYVEDKTTYSRLLHKGDVIVSTATYEFFSVAILEAIYAGCHPVLPKAQTYPEIVPEHLHKPLLHAPVFYENEDELFQNLRSILTLKTKPLPKTSLTSMVSQLGWEKQIRVFDTLFEQVQKQKQA